MKHIKIFKTRSHPLLALQPSYRKFKLLTQAEVMKAQTHSCKSKGHVISITMSWLSPSKYRTASKRPLQSKPPPPPHTLRSKEVLGVQVGFYIFSKKVVCIKQTPLPPAHPIFGSNLITTIVHSIVHLYIERSSQRKQTFPFSLQMYLILRKCNTSGVHITCMTHSFLILGSLSLPSVYRSLQYALYIINVCRGQRTRRFQKSGGSLLVKKIKQLTLTACDMRTMTSLLESIKQ